MTPSVEDGRNTVGLVKRAGPRNSAYLLSSNYMHDVTLPAPLSYLEVTSVSLRSFIWGIWVTASISLRFHCYSKTAPKNETPQKINPKPCFRGSRGVTSGGVQGLESGCFF